MKQRLDRARGNLDAREAASILADQYDPVTKEVRGLGNTVGVHTNMTSVVLDPDRNRFFMATGEAPVVHSEFIELPLIGSFDRDHAPQGSLTVIDNREFIHRHPEKWKALQIFIHAKRAYEHDNNIVAAYDLLRQVVEVDPGNPAYIFQLGIFALKNRRYDDALSAFDEVLKAENGTQQLRRLAWYYRGRTHAHEHRPADAIKDLTKVMDDP